MLGCALMSLFLAALEQTALGPAVGDIVGDLGGGPLLPWIATAYLMVATAASPILSALADVYGRRYLLLASVGLFVAGSVICGLAGNLPWLIVGRAVQGAGAGGLFSLPFVVITDLVRAHRRAIFAAGISSIYLVASILGPLVGGALSDGLHWSAVFWINLPLGAIAAAGIWSAGPMGSARRDRRVDVRGAALLTAASFTIVLALDRAAAGVGQGFLPAVMLAVLAAGFLAAFWRRMLRAPDPLVPVGVLTDRTILFAALALFCCQGTNVGLSVYFPLYWRAELGMSATEAGIAVLGLLGGLALGPYLSPRLLLRDPRYRPLMVASSVIAAAGAFLLASLAGLEAGMVPVQLAAVLLGLGVGLLYPTFLLVIQNAASPDSVGAAIGTLSFMRALGATMGVSATGIVAVSSGLEGGDGSGWPTWTLFLPGLVLMLVCLATCAGLPNRRLEGYSVRG